MVVTFTAHNSDISSSCSNVIDYLNKENSERLDKFWEAQENPSEVNEEEILIEKNLFFNNEIGEDGKEILLNDKEASKLIDENISSKAKDKESKFFMLNISPSKAELNHMKEIAELELERQGFGKQEQEILNSTDDGKNILEEMRNDLMHQQLKEYSKIVMKDYAENFNREVYKNPDLLPTRAEEKDINIRAKEIMKDYNFPLKSDEYLAKIQEVKQNLALKIGKDLSKRPMSEKDIVWVGKVEEKRSYKENDKWVMQNKKILKEISVLKNEPKKNANEIIRLENTLNRDKTTNQIVQSGMLKGGDNYHVHVLVSRYTKCPNADKKVSISPLANHKQGKVADTNKSVGFNRDNFRTKVEQSFDQKFKFERLNTYENYKNRKLSLNKNVDKVAKVGVNYVKNAVLQPIKNEIAKNTGINEIRKLNPKNTISQELGFKIPLSLPKTPLQGAVKLVRSAIGKIIDHSKGI